MQELKIRSQVFSMPIGYSTWFLVSVEKKDQILVIKHSPKTKNGLVKIEACIDSLRWKTSLLPYKSIYLIALKKDIRRKQAIQEGDIIDLSYRLLN